MNINESGKFEQKNVVAMSISLLGGDLKQHIFFWRQTRSALVCELFKAHLHAARPSKNLKPSHHHQQQPKSLKVFLFIFLEVPFYLYIYFFFGWKTRISVCVCAELKYIFLPVPWVCVCVSLPQIPPPHTHTVMGGETRVEGEVFPFRVLYRQSSADRRPHRTRFRCCSVSPPPVFCVLIFIPPELKCRSPLHTHTTKNLIISSIEEVLSSPRHYCPVFKCPVWSCRLYFARVFTLMRSDCVNFRLFVRWPRSARL